MRIRITRVLTETVDIEGDTIEDIKNKLDETNLGDFHWNETEMTAHEGDKDVTSLFDLTDFQ